jgi:alpha-L-rhamnosidase
MRKAQTSLRLVALFSLITLSGCQQGIIRIKDLYCENYTDPVGIERSHPRLSWILESKERNQLQAGYRIIVSSSIENLNNNRGDIWDSEKVESDQSILIAFKGGELKPATKCFWKVKVWNQDGAESEWSKPGTWQMGLLHRDDWQGAKWIGYRELPDSMRLVPGAVNNDARIGNRVKERTVVPYFRKEFSISKEISEAVLFISGLGHYEAFINGEKTGTGFLTPGWTNYDKSILYNCYDVKELLHQGINALGVIAGNGFYYINQERYFKLLTAFGEPSLISLLRLKYSDGSTENIVTDLSWKCTPSPITYSSIYGGEDYDACLEQDRWNKPDFNDTAWQSPVLIHPPAGDLLSEKDYPVSVMEVIDVKEIRTLTSGGFLYDFGQNASGIPELKVKGRRGQQIRLIPAELITEDNMANQKASGEPFYFTYTLKGDGIETWRPSFTYYGFRYVQVEGAVPDSFKQSVELPRIIELKMLHTRNSSPSAGSFECSGELFNKTNELIMWAIRSNLQSVVTDCPHREKLGWLEQTHLMGGSIHYNYDICHLYSKIVRDMREAQIPDGFVPNFVPEYKQSTGGFRDSPEWGSASVILPWLIYKWYGDTSIINEAWPMMCGYVDFLKSKADHHILSHGLGDWFDLGPKNPGPSQLTPLPLTATAIYYYDLVLLSKMAGVLKKQNEMDYYASWAADVKTAFNNRFYDPVSGVYSTGSQTAMSMPWCAGLVDDENKDKVMDILADSILANGKALTAGDVGFHYLVSALTQGGKSQLLYEMNARDDIPGYGYQLKKGATALTESWAALESVSNNHLMLGHLMEWFYEGLGGIGQGESSSAYREIVIKPEIVGDITFTRASYNSPYGKIICEWRKSDEKLFFNVTIPVNTTARVFIPTDSDSVIKENGKHIDLNDDIKFLGEDKDRKIYQLGSGNYSFKIYK